MLLHDCSLLLTLHNLDGNNDAVYVESTKWKSNVQNELNKSENINGNGSNSVNVNGNIIASKIDGTIVIDPKVHRLLVAEDTIVEIVQMGANFVIPWAAATTTTTIVITLLATIRVEEEVVEAEAEALGATEGNAATE